MIKEKKMGDELGMYEHLIRTKKSNKTRNKNKCKRNNTK
jgi:hypothetical protein